MEARPTPVEAAPSPPAGPTDACVLGSKHARTSFVVATEQLEDGMPVVSVSGELDLATAPALEESLFAACDRTDGPVMVDLGRCPFIDLRGLHVLLGAQKSLERGHRRLKLITGNPSVLRILQVTRVDGFFDIYPSRAAATGDHDG